MAKKTEHIEITIKGFYIHATGDAVGPALEAAGQLLRGILPTPAIEPPKKRRPKAITGKPVEIKDVTDGKRESDS